MRAEKPEIPAATLAKWQRVVDLAAKIARVPASLVMRTDAPDHAVLVASRSAGNPYEVGQSFTLHPKLYCYAVLEKGEELLVRDARADPAWDDNDDLEFGMSFYLGYPLAWPDGSLFGTICILDRRENAEALAYRELLSELRGLIEGDLALLIEVDRRRRLEGELKETLKHLERRVFSRTAELEEANTALKVLLRQVEGARAELEDDVLSQINSLVLPHLAKLRAATPPGAPAEATLALLEANLASITSGFAGRMASELGKLTPVEKEVAEMVAHGYTTKRIASVLSRETSTIDFHRNNIRKKLGIDQRSVNLRTYLLSMR